MRRDAQRNRQRIPDAAQRVFAERAHLASGPAWTTWPSGPASAWARCTAAPPTRRPWSRRCSLALPSGWDGLVHFLTTVPALQAGGRGLRETALSTGFGRSRVAVLRDRVKDELTRVIAAATAEGTLRPGITGHDVALILFMIGETGQSHESTRPDLTRRYLEVILDGLRVCPGNRDLGRPMDDEDVDRFVQGWNPPLRPAAGRSRARASPDPR